MNIYQFGYADSDCELSCGQPHCEIFDSEDECRAAVDAVRGQGFFAENRPVNAPMPEPEPEPEPPPESTPVDDTSSP